MRVFILGLSALLVGVIAFTGASFWWLAPAGSCLVGFWLMRRDRCEHLYPALLPAIRHADGTTLPAKWFCCDCGESWAAGPVRRRQGSVKKREVTTTHRPPVLPTVSATASASDQVA